MASAPHSMASRICRSSIDEVLAQQRQLHGGADLPEMLERTLKKLFVGQHRQTACTCRFVCLRDANRIEVLANHACRGRRLFDLGDKGDVAGREAWRREGWRKAARKSRRSPCSSSASRKSPAAMSRAGNFATSRFFSSTILSKMFITLHDWREELCQENYFHIDCDHFGKLQNPLFQAKLLQLHLYWMF